MGSGTSATQVSLQQDFERNFHSLMDETQEILDGGVLDDAGIHTLRKKIKSLRAGLRLIRHHCKQGLTGKAEKGLRNLAHLYGDARDLYVMLQTLAELEHSQGSEESALRFQRCRRLLDAELKSGKSGSASMARQKVGRNFRELRHGHPEWNSPLLDNLRHCYRKARRRYFKALDSGKPGDWHACRKWVKYLHNQMELLNLPGHSRANAELDEQFSELASRLGEQHDQVVLRDKLRQLEEARPDDGEMQTEARAVDKLAARAEKRKLKGVPKLARRCLGAGPKAFIKRLDISHNPATARQEG